MKKWLLGVWLLWGWSELSAQVTYPVNGIADERGRSYAFTNATIIKNSSSSLSNATLIIRDGKIVSLGAVSIPEGAVVIDCKGQYIYPSFVDIYSDYGIAMPQRAGGESSFFGPQQLSTNTKGPFSWNQAIRSEVNGYDLFTTDAKKAEALREQGFGAVVSHQKDGIARGTGVAAVLSDRKENMNILKDRTAAFYSFNKGTSTQSYPTSMMGSVALLRQTFIDADWYAKNKPAKEGINKSLEAWNANKVLPQVFEAGDKWGDLRADRIGDEFGVQFIIKAGDNEYQRIKEIAATKAAYILSLNYPETQNIEDPMDARFVSVSDMAHWELAPGNAAAFEKAGIPFVITPSDLKDIKSFWPSLRKAIAYGLTPRAALAALTTVPASLMKIDDKVGSIEVGKVANFLITTGELFSEKTSIVENWVNGERYNVKAKASKEQAGQYKLSVTGAAGVTDYVLDVKNNSQANLVGKDTLTTRFKSDGTLVSINFSLKPSGKPSTAEKKDSTFSAAQAGFLYRLSGVDYGKTWQGVGRDNNGQPVTWTATLAKESAAKKDTTKAKTDKGLAKVNFPFSPYGSGQVPVAENILIKNATVWTNEKEGRLENADVLLRDGKIAAVGKNIAAVGTKTIDGTGKFLTPGIIDEHSHIAAFSINEGAQSVTSEVRVGDNLNPDDVNIYRQLSGGVTTSHILHGSANTIGGQTQLIKLRWGADDEGLKFKGADPFIKFALGENVKRTAQSQGNIRFPDTRMGVQSVLADAFQRAKDYEAKIKAGDKTVRRDLELDALVEILNNKRFITCHSYVQSEILALLSTADEYGFRVNTLTHILEGYKVADAIKKHGAHVSTFSDWWAYKTEVQDAIPFNAAIMHKMGLNVCINSDDAEMARRLNQEAAKVVKYGGVSEEDAFKMVTLNPAKALHIDSRVGSIKVGKDADVVLWDQNPLSVYAKALYTIVDGAVYFDREKDLEQRKYIGAERNRLVQKMLADAKGGAPAVPAKPTAQVILHCEDNEQHTGILEIDSYEEKL
ncbi:amidohydrolase family protein [Niabella yanshanensis]|uniref:Amidohydrolase family protein n=1 Tax=Niabella yanshanensis TaxID=577386 RepID=A0ABZ0W7N8_9BACT|nr:amidohydrolase family protein [Niabella yanshanensis]WQD39293.1 amidohydrolase family protein [Niabella yanshanensis]